MMPHETWILLKDGTTPYCVTTARRIPFPMMHAVEKELLRMVDDDEIHGVTQPGTAGSGRDDRMAT